MKCQYYHHHKAESEPPATTGLESPNSAFSGHHQETENQSP